MESDKNEIYLPDLDNEKTREQIVFEQKVFRANKVFRWKMQDLINWFKLPNDSQVYPKSAMNNKHTIGDRLIYLNLIVINKYFTKK